MSFPLLLLQEVDMVSDTKVFQQDLTYNNINTKTQYLRKLFIVEEGSFCDSNDNQNSPATYCRNKK
jgi:hypothetical protein